MEKKEEHIHGGGGGWGERDRNNGRRGREAREIVEERKRCIYMCVCLKRT